MRTWQKWLVGVAAFLIILWVIMAVTLWSNTGGSLSGIWPEKKLGPKAQKALAVVRSQEDVKEAEQILNRGFAQPISCAVAVQNRVVPVAEENASEPHVRVYTYTWPDGTVECYDAPGNNEKLFHRVTGKPLTPMTDEQAAAIINKANAGGYGAQSGGTFWGPITRTAPAPHAQRPTPVATPLPELGQGPCCSN